MTIQNGTNSLNYCFAKEIFIFISSGPYLVLCSASLATLDEASSTNSTKAIPFREGINRTSTKFGCLRRQSRQ